MKRFTLADSSDDIRACIKHKKEFRVPHTSFYATKAPVPKVNPLLKGLFHDLFVQQRDGGQITYTVWSGHFPLMWESIVWEMCFGAPLESVDHNKRAKKHLRYLWDIVEHMPTGYRFYERNVHGSYRLGTGSSLYSAVREGTASKHPGDRASSACEYIPKWDTSDHFEPEFLRLPSRRPHVEHRPIPDSWGEGALYSEEYLKRTGAILKGDVNKWQSRWR